MESSPFTLLLQTGQVTYFPESMVPMSPPLCASRIVSTGRGLESSSAQRFKELYKIQTKRRISQQWRKNLKSNQKKKGDERLPRRERREELGD